MMGKRLGVRISGTGHFLPAKVIDNQYFSDHLDTSDAWIRERTGIIERRMASEGETTCSMSIAATEAALTDAEMTIDDIDMIIIATITPEAGLPSTACFLQKAMCNHPIPAFDISAACSGYLYGFIQASFMLQGGHYRNILVIGAETMTRIVDYEDRATCILFGDGAGATILSAVEPDDKVGILHFQMNAEGSGDELLFIPGGGSRLPPSQMTIDERLHYVKMSGRDVYKRAVKRNHELVDVTLAETGVKAEDISLVIPHQSNLRIIESARQRMGLPEDRMFTNIQKTGNTSAASIPIGLDQCLRNGRLKQGELTLLIAFGAGFTWASVLLQL